MIQYLYTLQNDHHSKFLSLVSIHHHTKLIFFSFAMRSFKIYFLGNMHICTKDLHLSVGDSNGVNAESSPTSHHKSQRVIDLLPNYLEVPLLTVFFWLCPWSNSILTIDLAVYQFVHSAKVYEWFTLCQKCQLCVLSYHHVVIYWCWGIVLGCPALRSGPKSSPSQ